MRTSVVTGWRLVHRLRVPIKVLVAHDRWRSPNRWRKHQTGLALELPRLRLGNQLRHTHSRQGVRGLVGVVVDVWFANLFGNPRDAWRSVTRRPGSAYADLFRITLCLGGLRQRPGIHPARQRRCRNSRRCPDGDEQSGERRPCLRHDMLHERGWLPEAFVACRTGSVHFGFCRGIRSVANAFCAPRNGCRIGHLDSSTRARLSVPVIKEKGAHQ